MADDTFEDDYLVLPEPANANVAGVPVPDNLPPVKPPEKPTAPPTASGKPPLYTIDDITNAIMANAEREEAEKNAKILDARKRAVRKDAVIDAVTSGMESSDDSSAKIIQFQAIPKPKDLEPAFVPKGFNPAVYAIGNFDGIHKGHITIWREARKLADYLGVHAMVLSFEPHPKRVFNPDGAPFMLSNPQQRANMARQLGMDGVVTITFAPDLYKLPARDFIHQILCDRLNAKGVVVGADFVFGANRSGSASLLESYAGQGLFHIKVVPPVCIPRTMAVSSSRIRAFLQLGRPEKAMKLLGRPWQIVGKVIHGDKRGRTLGYPTANIRPVWSLPSSSQASYTKAGNKNGKTITPEERYLEPALGVYAVRMAEVETVGENAGKIKSPWRHGVANFGIRPMFVTAESGNPEALLEVHLFDFDGDLYDKTMAVELIAYQRAEAKFDSIEALIDQMNQDSARARENLKTFNEVDYV